MHVKPQSCKFQTRGKILNQKENLLTPYATNPPEGSVPGERFLSSYHTNHITTSFYQPLEYFTLLTCTVRGGSKEEPGAAAPSSKNSGPLPVAPQ